MTTPQSTVHPIRCTIARWARRLANRLEPQTDLVQRVRAFTS